MTALLFERDRVDEVADWTSRLGHLGRRSILENVVHGLFDNDAFFCVVLGLIVALAAATLTAARARRWI